MHLCLTAHHTRTALARRAAHLAAVEPALQHIQKHARRQPWRAAVHQVFERHSDHQVRPQAVPGDAVAAAWQHAVDAAQPLPRQQLAQLALVDDTLVAGRRAGARTNDGTAQCMSDESHGDAALQQAAAAAQMEAVLACSAPAAPAGAAASFQSPPACRRPARESRALARARTRPGSRQGVHARREGGNAHTAAG